MTPRDGDDVQLSARDGLRPLRPADLDAVVDLDRRNQGQPRRRYFETRLQAALRDPRRHEQLAVDKDGSLAGFVLARTSDGDYGRDRRAMVFETIDVDARLRRAGLGRRLLSGLEDRARALDIPLLVTQASWRDRALLPFLDRSGFALAPRHVLARAVAMPVDEGADRIAVRSLRAEDVDRVTLIDRKVGGRERRDAMRGRVATALHESSVQVSLAAENDGYLVGFAMARVDWGDQGRFVPSASLDTLGVHPDFAGKGFGTALMAQMLRNLAALHVDRLETEVAATDLRLLGFLYRQGFAPSERLAFEKAIVASGPPTVPGVG